MVSSMQFVRDQTLHPSEFVIKNKCDPTFPYKGTEQRLYLDTSHVISGDSYIGDKVEWNKKIIKRAQLSVAESTSNYTAGTVEVKKIKNSWSAENITWNTQPELGNTIASFKCNGVDRNRHTLDITEAVTEMISNGELNNGLAFVAKESGTGEVINGPELGSSYMWFSVEYYDAKINMTQYNWETKTATCATDYLRGLAEYDWAILKVDENIGNQTGWFGFGITNNGLINKSLTASGYTLYKGTNDTAYVLHKSEGKVTSEDKFFIRYNASLLPGESGGIIFDSSNIAWGTIMAQGGSFNVATRYNSYLFQYMKEQKDNDIDN